MVLTNAPFVEVAAGLDRAARAACPSAARGRCPDSTAEQSPRVNRE